jgi:lipoyl(octanoyl) transferase
MIPKAVDAPGIPTLDAVLQVYLLGSVDFESALRLQRHLAYEIAGARLRAALILCEHPPLITIGRQGSRAHIAYEPEELKARRWAVRWVNRGGGCFLHLPGQLTIYPILPLDRLKLGLQQYLSRLQDVLIALLDDFSIRAEPDPNQTAVCVQGRRIADLGVAVCDWVAYYGVVLNINADLEFLRRIGSGRGVDRQVTSIVRERHGPLQPALVRQRLLEHFATHFHFAQTSLFFEHSTLRRKAPSDAVATSS